MLGVLLRPREWRMWSAGGTAETKRVEGVECLRSAETKKWRVWSARVLLNQEIGGCEYWVSSLF